MLFSFFWIGVTPLSAAERHGRHGNGRVTIRRRTYRIVSIFCTIEMEILLYSKGFRQQEVVNPSAVFSPNATFCIGATWEPSKSPAGKRGHNFKSFGDVELEMHSTTDALSFWIFSGSSGVSPPKPPFGHLGCPRLTFHNRPSLIPKFINQIVSW